MSKKKNREAAQRDRRARKRENREKEPPKPSLEVLGDVMIFRLQNEAGIMGLVAVAISDLEVPTPQTMSLMVKLFRPYVRIQEAELAFCCAANSSTRTELMAGTNHRSRLFLQANEITLPHELFTALEGRLQMKMVGRNKWYTVFGED